MCNRSSLTLLCLCLMLTPLTAHAAAPINSPLVAQAAAPVNSPLVAQAAAPVNTPLVAHASPRATLQNRAAAALSDAVRRGDQPKVVALLNAGVDANGVATSQTTPLLWAAIMNRPSIAERLLAHGADVNRAIPSGHWTGLTPLIAAANGSGNIYSGALEPPAPPPGLDGSPAQRRSAAVRAWRERVTRWRMGYRKLVKMMVAHGANVNAQLALGTTAVDSAATDGDTETVRFLIAHGARLDLPSHEADILGKPHDATNGYNALVGAIYEDKHNPELVALLLAHGASPNSDSPSEMTPLGAAASSGDAALVRLLLKHGARPGDVDYYGRAALSYAGSHPEVAALLQKSMMSVSKQPSTEVVSS